MLDLAREAAPALSPSTLEKLKSIVPMEPADQVPMPYSSSVEMEMRTYLKEFKPPSAESGLQELGDETSKQIVPPAQWLARIRHLRETGRTEEAKAQLRSFLARHPNYPLDASLSKLLEESDSAIHE